MQAHINLVLVPYDDPQANPFRTVLPQMAVKNDNLMSLLLAYSGTIHSQKKKKKKNPPPQSQH